MVCEYNQTIECNCTYECPRHGRCCECIAYHRKSGFPACFFSKSAEKTYNRSLNMLIHDRQED